MSEAERSGSDEFERSLQSLEAAIRGGLSDQVVFERLHAGLAKLVGFKTLTVLKLDPLTLRSVRLYSSEPSYPVGGTKQHGRNAWSEAILDSHAVFIAHDLAELRATFPDSAAIEATGCGSIIAVPIVWKGGVVGTMNLWHRDGFYDAQKGARALPFATTIAPVCAR